MTDEAVQKIGDIIVVDGYNTYFHLCLPGIFTRLSFSDFRKMLTVISHEIDTDDCLKFYRLLQYELYRTDGMSELRGLKLEGLIRKKMDKLPPWVFEEATDDRL